jgi:catechol 2,3-dioxygenase-like lactoylglutathione lyase family enzyme
MLTSLDHVVVAVRDLAKATDLYASLLGLRPSWRGAHPLYGTANALFRLENTYVELLSPTGPGMLAERLTDWLARRGEGLFALAFGADDAPAVSHDLRARGLGATDPIDGVGTESTSGAERRWRNVMIAESDTHGVPIFAIEHRSSPDVLPPATPTGDPRAAIVAVDHVVVQSPAPDRAIGLYREKLGLRLALDRRFPDWGARLLFFRIGGITVEIAAPLAGDEPGEEDRLWGISYRTGDIDAAHERLVKAGFDASEVRRGRKPGTRVLTVRGEPCGVATLVLARDKS